MYVNSSRDNVRRGFRAQNSGVDSDSDVSHIENVSGGNTGKRKTKTLPNRTQFLYHLVYKSCFDYFKWSFLAGTFTLHYVVLLQAYMDPATRRWLNSQAMTQLDGVSRRESYIAHVPADVAPHEMDKQDDETLFTD